MPSPVYLLVTSPDAKGGIARATATLANHLVGTRRVEMICLYRRRRGFWYPLDPRVTVRCVLDEATPSERRLRKLPTQTPGGDRTGAYNALVDVVLPRILRSLDPGIVISTRAIFHLEIVRHVPAHCITIGQDHTSWENRRHLSALQLQEEPPAEVTDVDLVTRAIGRLDRYVVLTEADAESYRRAFPEVIDRLSVIANPAPWPVGTSARHRCEIVMGAGVLEQRKAFDDLIEAYRPIARRRPSWQLHIYGEGPDQDKLAELIERYDLGELVILKGATEEMERVLDEVSIVALTSRFEGLPMVLIEAITKGVPIVSVDCPNGPAEIVVDGVTGRLVPEGDLEAFTEALLGLMDDPGLRAEMSRQSLKHAEQYQVDRILATWLDLFDALEARSRVRQGPKER